MDGDHLMFSLIFGSETTRELLRLKRNSLPAVSPSELKFVKFAKNCLRTISHNRTREDFCTIMGMSQLNYNKFTFLLQESPKESFKCTFCSKEYPNKTKLKKHVLSHSAKKEYRCHICEKSFPLQIDLKIHRRGHKYNCEFPCEICEYKKVQSIIKKESMNN